MKDRIERFDDYYPCMQNECNLFHVHNWIQFFVSMYNDTIANKNEFVIQLQAEMVNLSLNLRNSQISLDTVFLILVLLMQRKSLEQD